MQNNETPSRAANPAVSHPVFSAAGYVDPASNTNLDHRLRTSDLTALQEQFNVTFDERNQIDVGLATVAENTLRLVVQENELSGRAQDNDYDHVDEAWHREIAVNDVEIVLADGTILRPTAIDRVSKIADASTDWWPNNGAVVRHEYSIVLPESLDENAQYTLRFKTGALDDISFTPFDDVSDAIKNARAYDIDMPEKFAKLSSYMGLEQGGVEYEEGTAFRVINTANGQVVHEGGITLAQEADQHTGADVWDIDFSPVTEAGAYRIEVDGVGMSHEFEIRDGVFEDMLDLSLEGLMHHRAFSELDGTHSDYIRPANEGIKFYKSSISNAETDLQFESVRQVDANGNVKYLAGDKILADNADRSEGFTAEEIWGGWFDAGDYDTNRHHFKTVEDLVRTHNSNPEAMGNFESSVPVVNENLPDILNEALWGLQLWMNTQDVFADDVRMDANGNAVSGGIGGGYEFDGGIGGVNSWDVQEAFLYAPDFLTSYDFVAAASAMAEAVEPYDASLAADLEDRAIRAFEWAELDMAAREDEIAAANQRPRVGRIENHRQQAAVELYKLTGDEDYHDVVLTAGDDGNGQIPQNHDAHVTYAGLDPGQYAVDADFREYATNQVLQAADGVLDFAEENGYDTLNNPAFGQSWGFNSYTTTDGNLNIVAYAYELTGDEQYLNAIAKSMNFGLGMNPDNMAQTTGTVARGLAYDEPDDVLHSDGHSTAQDVDGITVYGFYSLPWWLSNGYIEDNTDIGHWDADSGTTTLPFLENYQDFHLYIPQTEYTIHQTINGQIYAWGTLTGALSDGDIGGTSEPEPLPMPELAPEPEPIFEPVADPAPESITSNNLTTSTLVDADTNELVEGNENFRTEPDSSAPEVPPSGPTPPVPGGDNAEDTIGEYGTLSLDHHWQTIALEDTYDNPVVIVSDPTLQGVDPAAVRLRNVGEDTFQIRLQEPGYKDDWHKRETVSYLVMEAGDWSLADGTRISAGTQTSDRLTSQGFDQVSLSEFDTAPTVLSQVQTYNGPDWVTTRTRGQSAGSFQLAMQEEEALNDGFHVDETIGWLAIEQGIASDGDTLLQGGTTDRDHNHKRSEVRFEESFESAPAVIAKLGSFYGGDTANLLLDDISTMSFGVSVYEEQSLDNELNHVYESVSFLALEGSAGMLTGVAV